LFWDSLHLYFIRTIGQISIVYYFGFDCQENVLLQRKGGKSKGVGRKYFRGGNGKEHRKIAKNTEK